MFQQMAMVQQNNKNFTVDVLAALRTTFWAVNQLMESVKNDI